jgi:hypothetical protein
LGFVDEVLGVLIYLKAFVTPNAGKPLGVALPQALGARLLVGIFGEFAPAIPFMRERKE